MHNHKQCPRGTHLKFWMLRHSFMILVGLVLAALAVFAGLIYCYKGAGELPWRELLAAYTGFATFGYFLVSHQRKQTDLLLALINRYHRRCAEMFGGGKLDLQDDNNLGAYLDLCAEEYYLYCQGHVPPEVWDTWRAGMRKNLCEDKDVCKGAKEKMGDEGRLYCGLTMCIICGCCCGE